MSKGNNSVLSFLQKIGKSLMVPIAVMPALGLLLRLGDTDLLNLPWMKAAGNSAFGANMAMLFAVGIGFGLADENNGVGGLSGLLGYLVMTSVAKTFDATIDMGVFAGVIAGVVGGLLYNKFKDIKVPAVLGFFGGKRFVPIITSAVCLLLGVFFGYLWPTCQAGLDSFASGMASAGAFGAALYGFFNRLLIPVGLHHILNTVIWFQLGSFMDPVKNELVNGDIPRFLAGDATAGIYTAGFYPIMMFGLPAACLAMYFTAKKARQKEVGGMLLSLAATAIVTGITEPIEFAFMFLSPLLYGIHAVLTAISLAITYTLGIHHAFSFSGGLIDYILYYGKATKAIQLLPIGIMFFVIYFFVFTFFIKKFDLKTPGREDDEIIEEETTSQVASSRNNLSDKAANVLEAIGGKENIDNLDACVTRIRVTLKDGSKVDEMRLKKLGASGVMKLGSNNYQIVVGTIADPLVSQMKKLM